MFARTLITAAAVVLVLSGCAHPRYAMPHGAKIGTCNTASFGGQCKIAVVESASGHSCALGKFDVDPEGLELQGGKTAYIRWSLPDKYEFCAAEGDGVFPKVETAAARVVTEAYTSDREDGSRGAIAPSASCRSFYHWTHVNKPAGIITHYEIRFRDKAGTVCVIDPWIKNG